MVELSCADGGSGIAPTSANDLAGGGVTLEGLAGNVEGSRPADVGLGVPSGQSLYFIKAPAWLRARAAKTTIELSASSGGYLAWVPARIWTNGGRGGIDLTPWMTSKVVFDGCPDTHTTYFGGLLSTDPHICLSVQVAAVAGESRQIQIGSKAHC